MFNSYKIKACLKIFIQNNPIIFDLQPGENILGSDPQSCKFILDFPEIDKLQAKISIYEYGEISIESLSDFYANYKEYEVIPGYKHHIKLRKNKEYDLFDGSVFYFSNYKAIFTIKYEQNFHQNNTFMSTLFVPDREFIEETENSLEKNHENSRNLDFLPTQLLDPPQMEILHSRNIGKSKEIRKIFRDVVEKIKKSCKEKNHENENDNKQEEITKDILSKFASLYDSMKEEFASTKCTQQSMKSNSNSKGFSTVESPISSKANPIFFKTEEKNKENKKEVQFSIGNGFKKLSIKDYLHPKIDVSLEKEKNANEFFNNEKFEEKPNTSSISNKFDDENKSENEKLEENSNETFHSPKKNDSEDIKTKLFSVINQINANPPIKSPTKNITSPSKISDENHKIPLLLLEQSFKQNQIILEPTLKESQLAENLLFAPTLKESQLAENLLFAPTIRESQQNSDNFNFGSTIRESQVNNDFLVATIRESQLPVKEKLEFTPTLIQENEISLVKNEEKVIGKYIRDSKRNSKKRKIDLPDLLKIEKRKNLEKKMQEEQFQSLKLFIKDSVDDLEDLFESSVAKEKKEEQLNGINDNNDKNITNEIIKAKLVNLKPFELKKEEKKIDQKKITKKKAEKQKINEENAKIEKCEERNEEKSVKKESIEPQNPENKKPKLYLTQKTLCFTSNDSLNNSLKKASKKPIRKAYLEENDESGENCYHLPIKEEIFKSQKNFLLDNKEIIHKSLHNKKGEEEEKDSGTERLDSEKENNKEIEKNALDYEEQKTQNEKKKLTKKKNNDKKNKSDSIKVVGNMKIMKTLTQIFSSQSQENKPSLTVSFSGFKPTKKEIEQLRELKIEIIDDLLLETCDALIIKTLKKEAQILIAINKGIDIISKKWMEDTLQAKTIQLLESYHYKDPDFEKTNNFFLEQSILKARLQGGLLKNYNVWISDNKKDLKNIIESAGGVILHKMPEKNEEKTVIVVEEKKRRLISDLVEQKIVFIFPDFLMEACLKQEFIL